MSTTKVKNFHLIEDLDIAVATYNLIARIEAIAVMIRTTLSTWISRSRERQQLSHMSDRMLLDIGLSRSDIDSELSKFFWQK